MISGWCAAEVFERRGLAWPGPAKAALVLLLAGSLAGCAGLAGKSKTPEEIVAERAQARWDELVAGQWERAYSFATPAYREVVDAQGFRARHGGQASWLGATVRKVQCQADACEATVRLKYRSLMPPKFDQLETDYKERWLLEDGKWWIYLRP